MFVLSRTISLIACSLSLRSAWCHFPYASFAFHKMTMKLSESLHIVTFFLPDNLIQTDLIILLDPRFHRGPYHIHLVFSFQFGHEHGSRAAILGPFRNLQLCVLEALMQKVLYTSLQSLNRNLTVQHNNIIIRLLASLGMICGEYFNVVSLAPVMQLEVILVASGAENRTHQASAEVRLWWFLDHAFVPAPLDLRC